jgi:hypothetical protein
MNVRTVEIRDSATFIPALAIRLDSHCEQDCYLLTRAGYGSTPTEQGEYILLIHLESMKCATDPMDWGNRTMQEAHRYLIEQARAQSPQFEHGEVIDVQFILGEADSPKVSERITFPFL